VKAEKKKEKESDDEEEEGDDEKVNKNEAVILKSSPGQPCILMRLFELTS